MSKYVAIPLIIALLASYADAADRESAMAWLKYLKGEWTSELNDGEQIVTELSTWRFAAKRNATIGRFKQPDGSNPGVEIGGWMPDTKELQFNGYNAEGDYWQIKFDQVSGEGGEAKIQGTYRGNAYKGTFTAKVTDRDTWTWTLKGKSADGTDVNVTCKLTRKK